MSAPVLDTAIDAVVIGRNEGPRLVRCLGSLTGRVARLVYVDSGSTDQSLDVASAAGAEIVELDLDHPFTAARARNAGVDRLRQGARAPLLQFVDGDCELREGWLATAAAALTADPGLAVVCGRRRERHPQATLWNRLIDAEWDTPVGPARACGGDSMMRAEAFDAVGGFDPNLIAGEEPELCVRLRAVGWRVERLDAEMTLHDAAMTEMRQWWVRTRRAGFAYAEGAEMHGAPPERHKVAEMRRALIWGAGVPLSALAGCALIGPWALLILLAWPAQVLRLRLRGLDATLAFFLTLGKLPEALGILSFHRRRLLGGERRLIEYK
ncbi:MAG: glycosyltransferase [Pseudomonadota bacterium]